MIAHVIIRKKIDLILVINMKLNALLNYQIHQPETATINNLPIVLDPWAFW